MICYIDNTAKNRMQRVCLAFPFSIYLDIKLNESITLEEGS